MNRGDVISTATAMSNAAEVQSEILAVSRVLNSVWYSPSVSSELNEAIETLRNAARRADLIATREYLRTQNEFHAATKEPEGKEVNWHITG